MKNIANKMSMIQSEFPAVSKERKSDPRSGANYNYRGIDDALRVLNPLLSKHRVFLLPSYRSARTESCQTSTGKPAFRSVVTGELRFVCGDTGEYVIVDMVGEGMDMADKGTMKAQANAMKYAIFYTFCVPTEEPKDSESFATP